MISMARLTAFIRLAKMSSTSMMKASHVRTNFTSIVDFVDPGLVLLAKCAFVSGV